MDAKDLRLLQLLYHTAQMSEESRQDLGDLITRLQAPAIPVRDKRYRHPPLN